jgi:hypothetical protein
MTPAESRQLASLIQTFSPAEKADFYYFTMVEEQDPVAYVARMRKHSLVDLIKASFGGDRSAAGRYAAQQRWKNQQKKIEKPKDDDPPPIDKRLVQAQKVLDDAFGNNAIATLRSAWSVPAGVSTVTSTELELAGQVEAAGKLIDQVIGEELAKLENDMQPKRDALSATIKELGDKRAVAISAVQPFLNAGYEVMNVLDKADVKAAFGERNPLFEGSELAANAAPDTVEWAVREGQRKVMQNVIDGKMNASELSSLSDEALLQLVARDTTKYGKGDKRISRMASYGDSSLHARQDLLDNPPYTREQKNQAFLTLMRQQLNGDFGNAIRSEAPKLGDTKQNEKDRKDLLAAQEERKALAITPAQRQEITKKALSDIGVVFGKAGQVPVNMQIKKEDPNSWSGAKMTTGRKADETPRGRKFQALIDEATQLLPATLWNGSVSTGSQVDTSKHKAMIRLDIKGGRAHAQKIQTFEGFAINTKLKLNAVKLDEEPSNEWRSVALHEMGHAAEYGNTWLTQMEYAYWHQRAGTEPRQRLSKITGNSGYGRNEVAAKDKWGEPYAGKIYKDNRASAMEIFTIGIEGVFYGTRKIDPEHRAFTLGLLALSTKIKD